MLPGGLAFPSMSSFNPGGIVEENGERGASDQSKSRIQWRPFRHDSKRHHRLESAYVSAKGASVHGVRITSRSVDRDWTFSGMAYGFVVMFILGTDVHSNVLIVTTDDAGSARYPCLARHLPEKPTDISMRCNFD